MNCNVDEFNKEVLVGSKIIYKDDFGNYKEVITSSIAWEVCGTVCVSLKGKSGGIDIERMAKI